MNAEQQVIQWGQIVANAWKNESFKKRLLTDPATILKDYGLKVPAGAQLHVHENTDQALHLTLPAPPQERELSDAELAGVAGGVVTLEYLVLGTILALGLMVGVSAAGQNPESPKAPPPTKKR